MDDTGRSISTLRRDSSFDESNPFLVPPSAPQLEKVDDGVFSFRKKKPIAKRIIPQSPIRPPRKSPANPKRTELVERPTAADSVATPRPSAATATTPTRSNKPATDRKKDSRHRHSKPKAPAVGTDNCDLVWKGKFLTCTLPRVEVQPVKKKNRSRTLGLRKAGEGKDEEDASIKPIVTRIPGVVFALPREYNRLAPGSGLLTPSSSQHKTEQTSRKSQIMSEGTSMQVVSRIQLATFPSFLLRSDVKPCLVAYFRGLLDEDTVFDALARSVSSDNGSALADVGLIVRVLAEKTKKPKKKLTLMEAILQQRATLRNNQKENPSFEPISDDDLKQKIIYQKTTTFLICGSVRQGTGGVPTLSYKAHPLVDYGSITKTILLSSQSNARPTNNTSGSEATLERKPIIDVNDLAEHVTKENPTDLDQGLGLLPEQDSLTSELTPVKKDEDEQGMKINDPFVANLIYGIDDVSDDEDMEEFEGLALNLRDSLTVDQEMLVTEPVEAVRAEANTPKRKSLLVEKRPAADKSPIGAATLEGSKKRRAPAPALASDSLKSSSTSDPATMKKRKTPLPTITVESPLSPTTVVRVTAPSLAVVPPSAMSTVLSTPKVTPLPAEVSATPSVAPKALTTTEHRNKETIKALMNTVLAKINIGPSHEDFDEYSDEVQKRVLFSMRKDVTTKLYHLEELERLMDRHAEML
ncbi:hypothetical protein EMPS_06891 [Entomortierella parvispora]|uniref:Uncharacterized protein n=1 Tax=Entomortierella parvispora TaxID=205924 RepID=A0A9P3HDK4_9FUNG|nr:hypothetical protein EMPS_06891 [Entomortierella parvispora]